MQCTAITRHLGVLYEREGSDVVGMLVNDEVELALGEVEASIVTECSPLNVDDHLHRDVPGMNIVMGYVCLCLCW